jgi:RNase P subunit RPR2
MRTTKCPYCKSEKIVTDIEMNRYEGNHECTIFICTECGWKSGPTNYTKTGNRGKSTLGPKSNKRKWKKS